MNEVQGRNVNNININNNQEGKTDGNNQDNAIEIDDDL